MYINRIEINNYRLFSLNNIKSLTIDIVSPYTLILGTNGCGKSALLKLLSPEPAQKRDFNPGGFVRLWINHQGSEYLLESNFESKARYSFVKDEVELNGTTEGSYGTATVQRELAKTHLQYSRIIHELLTARLCYTELTGEKRKEILTLINPLNLEYATEVWERSKWTTRDLVGVIKHLTVKHERELTEQKELNIDKKAVQTLGELEKQLENILQYTQQSVPSHQDINVKISQLSNRIEEITNHWLTFKPRGNIPSSVSNHESLLKEQGVVNGKLILVNAELQAASDEYDTLVEKLGGSMDFTLDRETLLKKIKQSLSTLNTLDKPFVTGDPTLVQEQLHVVNSEVEYLFKNNPISLIVSAKEQENILQQHKKSVFGISTLESNINKIKHQLENHSQHIDIRQCPACQHSFNINGQQHEDEIKRLDQRLSEKMCELNEAKQIVITLEEQANAVQYYQTLWNELTGLSRSRRLPQVFWDELSPLTDLMCNQNQWTQQIHRWRRNLEQAVNYNEAQQQYKTCQSILEINDKYGWDYIGIINRKKESITELSKQRQELLASIKTLEDIKQHWLYWKKKYNDLYTLTTKLDEQFMRLGDALIHEDALKVKQRTHDKLSTLQSSLRKEELLHETTRKTEQELTDCTKRHKALDILTKSLSPNTGVIAKQMTDFINNFNGKINTLMAQLWGYELSINAVGIEEGKLDYRFTMTVEGETVPDLSLASKGQKEIINLAFIMVMREYLSLTDYPLYIDETGVNFDETHRGKLMEYIKHVVSTGQCSQVFMVHHYASIHSVLTHHETVVLDDRNIAVPEDYNLQVDINHF